MVIRVRSSAFVYKKTLSRTILYSNLNFFQSKRHTSAGCHSDCGCIRREIWEKSSDDGGGGGGPGRSAGIFPLMYGR